MISKVLTVLSLLLATPCWAQADDQLFTAGKVLEMEAPRWRRP
jgi:hypothetical protein